LDAVLRDGAHLARHPTGINFASLLLTETRVMEVTLLNKVDNVGDELVLIQNGVYDDRHHICKKVAAENLHNNHNNHNWATSLEYGTTLRNDISVIPFDRRLDIHTELVQAVEVESVTDAAKN
jgi:hypothetical protein